MKRRSTPTPRLALHGLLLLALTACAPDGAPAVSPGSDAPPRPTGPYVGQTPPGATAELFAPGFVTTGMYTRDVAMTADGRELYFGVMSGGFSVIMETHQEGDGWTEPEVASFATDPRFFYFEPALSPDDQRLYFLHNRPPDGREPEPDEIRAWVNEDIWYVERTADGWGEPVNVGPPVDTEAAEFFPSFTSDGTIYFTRGEANDSYIWRARPLEGGGFAEPERLPPQVNSTPSQYNAFIARDESYLIVCTGGREDSLGGTDYYVVFRYEDDTWSEPVNLGPEVNTPSDGEFSPYVSPDGRYLFFMSTRPRTDNSLDGPVTRDVMWQRFTGPRNGNADIWWIDAGFIEGLRPPRG